MCTVMEEYQRDAVEQAKRETEREEKEKYLKSVMTNLRKSNPSLSEEEARKQAMALLGITSDE